MICAIAQIIAGKFKQILEGVAMESNTLGQAFYFLFSGALVYVYCRIFS